MRARSSWEAAPMTSSYKATGTASVRQTPAAALPNAGPWALAELGTLDASRGAKPPAQPTISPEERARLIDEGYARGLADGERKALGNAQAQIDGALALISQITARLKEVASVAPAILEDNIAALAV